MLNIDYKTFSLIFAKRLNSIMLTYTNLDQTGFVKGRALTNNTRCAITFMYAVMD